MTPEDRLASEGLVMPPAPESKGLYRTGIVHGGVLHLSAHGPFDAIGGFTHIGKVGTAVTTEEARKAAAACGLSLLASTVATLGELSLVDRALVMRGYVNSTSTFSDQAFVLDGACRVLEVAFGDDGRPARTAVGVASLPFDLPVVVELSLAVGAAS